MREAYQAQIDIEQNNIMKLFTLITAIFLPLTLMVGWYGMNFKYMYELDSIYGYPVFIVVSFIVCVLLILYFKKKRWFWSLNRLFMQKSLIFDQTFLFKKRTWISAL